MIDAVKMNHWCSAAAVESVLDADLNNKCFLLPLVRQVQNISPTLHLWPVVQLSSPVSKTTTLVWCTTGTEDTDGSFSSNLKSSVIMSKYILSLFQMTVSSLWWLETERESEQTIDPPTQAHTPASGITVWLTLQLWTNRFAVWKHLHCAF